MDLQLTRKSSGDRKDSRSDNKPIDDERVRNIHGETVGRRSKRYLVEADESSTDGDLISKEKSQNGDLFVNSDRVSSIDISPVSVPSNMTESKMSDKSSGVKKNNSYERLLLTGGKDLKGESVSDYEKIRKSSSLSNGSVSSNKCSDDATRKTSDASDSATAEGAADKPFTIPADGNLLSFSIDDMATFFRAMKVDELIVQRLHRKKLDGKKFSRLKDSVMVDIGIKNPIICYFRDKSKKDRLNFML